jgi:hypothetical protein
VASLIEALAEYGRALARQAHEAGVPVLRPSARRKVASRRKAR